MKPIKITCDHCGSEIELNGTTTPPDKKANTEFIYTKALLYGAKDICIRWGFYEQQADPVHKNFNEASLKAELRKLLDIKDK